MPSTPHGYTTDDKLTSTTTPNVLDTPTPTRMSKKASAAHAQAHTSDTLPPAPTPRGRAARALQAGLPLPRQQWTAGSPAAETLGRLGVMQVRRTTGREGAR